MSFVLDMNRFVDRIDAEIELAIKKVALDLTTDIIMDTPVDLGRARSNWFVSFEAPPTQTTDSTDASRAISNAAVVVNRGQIANYIYIQNNLDYIAGLEYGKSQQSPQGMVRKNVARYGG